jgi:nitrite transporter
VYTETINILSEQAVAKLEAQRRSLLSHFVRSMLAGMYVGASIVLIFTIGGSLAGEATRPFQRLLMGVCFGGALTLVIFAGSELFTGSNLVLTLGVLSRKARTRDLVDNWVWTWLGNLAGSLLLASMVVGSGLLDDQNKAFAGINKFVYAVFAAKTTPLWYQLFLRAVLANWLVCLGVWMAARVKSEPARILLIFWCMFTFITSGYEHSIANMTGLALALLQPGSPPSGVEVSWALYGYNLTWTTLGNIVGGALFVAGLYWIGSPKARAQAMTLRAAAEANGQVSSLEVVGVTEASRERKTGSP